MNEPADTPSESAVKVEELPPWARKVWEQVQSPGQTSAASTPTVETFVNGSAWPTFLSAAVVGAFQPRQLPAVPNLDEKDQKEAETAILGFSERVNGPDGARWTLAQEVRRSVLAAASPGDIAAAIGRTESTFDDPLSTALRTQITGSPTPGPVTTATLEAARLAALWLGDAQHKDAPKFETLDRLVTSRRLLRPFYNIVGIPDDREAPSNVSEIPIFGRDEEIGILDQYVGVAPTTSLLEGVSRLFSNARRSFTGDQPLMVWGGGGVGKTTLIARFLLEHAGHATARFPFIYLDFDRATISPRRPAYLLAEMCQQILAQFPELASQLRPLQSDASRLAAEFERSPEALLAELVTFKRTRPLLDRFREIAEAHTANLEGTLEVFRQRPFLLIFDTFEVVQYTDFAVSCIERFIQSLHGSRVWTRLRVIISGRKRLADGFLNGFGELKLGPLDRPGSIKMLCKLANDAGKPIAESDAEQLVNAVVSAIGVGDAKGLSPLRVRLLGDIFKTARQTDGGAIVAELKRELAGDVSRDATVARKFIDGILVRRILEHVADERVRALADPGLVVRRITQDVIRKVMAIGTPKPGSRKDIVEGDTLAFTPWELTDEQARDIFNAFGQEVRLVEKDGADFRHRQDVRQDMLPLIRVRRPQRFMNLHRLAFDYFSDQLSRNPDDAGARAEAIYHALWLDKPLTEIDASWPLGAAFDPRLDPAEFDDLPAARRYILAKTGQPMEVEDLAALPQAIASQWAIARSRELLELANVNRSVRLLRAATGTAFEGLDGHVGSAAEVARLLYRAGEWNDSRSLTMRHLMETSGGMEGLASPALADRADRVSLLRTWVTMSAKLGAEPYPLDVAIDLSRRTWATTAAKLGADLSRRRDEPDDLVQIEMLSYAALGHRMLKDRSGLSEDRKQDLAREVAGLAAAVPPTLWQRNERALRMAILAAGEQEETGALLGSYLMVGGISTLETVALPLAGRTLSRAYAAIGDKTLAEHARILTDQMAKSPDAGQNLRSFWTSGREPLSRAVRDARDLQGMVRKLVVFDHHDWARPFGNALTRLFETERGGSLRDALRKEDFVADPISRRSEFDGPSIVQWAAANGNLLSLVETIETFSDEDPPTASSPDDVSYPKTVFGIAEALLLWHDVNLEAAGGLDDDDPVPPPERGSALKSSRPPAKKAASKKRTTTRMRRKS